jgi:hypothetical protein
VRNAYIKFHTNEDRAIGFSELATQSFISRLSNDIFCIPWRSLALLDARNVHYSFATEDDLTNAKPIWNFSITTSR